MLTEMFLRYSTRSTSKRTDGMADNTVRTLLPYIKKYESFTSNYNYYTIINWLDSLNITNQSKATIASSMSRFMWFSKLISEEEMRLVKMSFKMTRRRWSDKEIEDELLFDIMEYFTMQHGYLSIRNQALVMTLAITGLRVSQLVDLSMDTVTIDDGGVTIETYLQKQTFVDQRDAVDIKHIPTNATISGIEYYPIMVEYIKHRQKIAKTKQFFTDYHGYQITQRGVQHIMEQLSTLFETKITCHTFRHNLITRVVNTHGLIKAAAIAGHASLETTKKYVKKNKLQLDEVYMGL